MTAFEPKDPDFAARVTDSFRRQQFMTTLGAELARVGPGTCEITLPYSDAISQQHGYFHGGVIGTLADNAAGYASFSLMPADATVLTVEYKLNLVSPGKGERLLARGLVLRPGRTLTVAESKVYAVTGGEKSLCAIALATMMCLHGKSDGPTDAEPQGDRA
jgi:uncharacterized protein (TIGR00369 family)